MNLELKEYKRLHELLWMLENYGLGEEELIELRDWTEKLTEITKKYLK
jgi:hypothetical protein